MNWKSKITSLLVILTISLLALQLSGSHTMAASNQLLLSSSQNYRVGQEFPVSFKADSVNLLAVIAKVNFDPAYVSFVRYDDAGSVFPGNVVFTPNTNSLEIAKNTVNFNLATGPSLITTLYFKPIKNGVSQITASGTGINSAGTAIGLGATPLSIPVGVTVNQPSSSTPTTKSGSSTTTNTQSASLKPDGAATQTSTITTNDQSKTDIAGTGSQETEADPRVKALISNIKAKKERDQNVKQRKVIVFAGIFIVLLLALMGLLYWRAKKVEQSIVAISGELGEKEALLQQTVVPNFANPPQGVIQPSVFTPTQGTAPTTQTAPPQPTARQTIYPGQQTTPQEPHDQQ